MVIRVVPDPHYDRIDATLEELQRLNDKIDWLSGMLTEAQQANGGLVLLLKDVEEELTVQRSGWQQGMLDRIRRTLK